MLPRLTLNAVLAVTTLTLASQAVGAGGVIVESGCNDSAQRLGGDGDAKPGCAADAAACLPDDVDLVVVVSKAASIRRLSAASDVARMVSEAGSLGDLAPAWTGLAQQLGWSKEEAFDRLLGTRVVIATRSRGEGRSWAVICDVSEETERRLFDRLQIAPRAIGGGHQILSIEKGAYELASHRVRGGAATGGRPSRRVVLGPAGRSELFDDILSSLAREEGDAGATKRGAITGLNRRSVFERGRSLASPDVLVLAQLDPALAQADPAKGTTDAAGDRGAGAQGGAGARVAREPWADFLVLGASQDPVSEPGRGAAWAARVIARQSGGRSDPARVPITDDTAFMALSEGALLVIVQSVTLSSVLGDDLALLDLSRALPMGLARDKGAAMRQAVCVRTAPARDRLACTVAVETADTAAAAAEMDGKIASFVGTLEKRFGADDPAPMDLGGLSPGAVRLLPLKFVQPGPFRAAFREPLTIAWAFPSAVASPGDDAADAAVRGPQRGWWVLGVSQSQDTDEPSAASLLRTDSRALCSGDPRARENRAGAAGRWIWIGMARPAALEARFPPELPDIRGFRSLMRRFERVDIRLSVGEGGEVFGDVKGRLSPDAPVLP